MTRQRDFAVLLAAFACIQLGLITVSCSTQGIALGLQEKSHLQGNETGNEVAGTKLSNLGPMHRDRLVNGSRLKAKKRFETEGFKGWHGHSSEATLNIFYKNPKNVRGKKLSGNTRERTLRVKPDPSTAVSDKSMQRSVRHADQAVSESVHADYFAPVASTLSMQDELGLQRQDAPLTAPKKTGCNKYSESKSNSNAGKKCKQMKILRISKEGNDRSTLNSSFYETDGSGADLESGADDGIASSEDVGNALRDDGDNGSGSDPSYKREKLMYDSPTAQALIPIELRLNDIDIETSVGDESTDDSKLLKRRQNYKNANKLLKSKERSATDSTGGDLSGEHELKTESMNRTGSMHINGISKEAWLGYSGEKEENVGQNIQAESAFDYDEGPESAERSTPGESDDIGSGIEEFARSRIPFLANKKSEDSQDENSDGDVQRASGESGDYASVATRDEGKYNGELLVANASHSMDEAQADAISTHARKRRSLVQPERSIKSTHENELSNKMAGPHNEKRHLLQKTAKKSQRSQGNKDGLRASAILESDTVSANSQDDLEILGLLEDIEKSPRSEKADGKHHQDETLQDFLSRLSEEVQSIVGQARLVLSATSKVVEGLRNVIRGANLMRILADQGKKHAKHFSAKSTVDVLEEKAIVALLDAQRANADAKAAAARARKAALKAEFITQRAQNTPESKAAIGKGVELAHNAAKLAANAEYAAKIASAQAKNVEADVRIMNRNIEDLQSAKAKTKPDTVNATWESNAKLQPSDSTNRSSENDQIADEDWEKDLSNIISEPSSSTLKATKLGKKKTKGAAARKNKGSHKIIFAHNKITSRSNKKLPSEESALQTPFQVHQSEADTKEFEDLEKLARKATGKSPPGEQSSHEEAPAEETLREQRLRAALSALIKHMKKLTNKTTAQVVDQDEPSEAGEVNTKKTGEEGSTPITASFQSHDESFKHFLAKQKELEETLASKQTSNSTNKAKMFDEANPQQGIENASLESAMEGYGEQAPQSNTENDDGGKLGEKINSPTNTDDSLLSMQASNRANNHGDTEINHKSASMLSDASTTLDPSKLTDDSNGKGLLDKKNFKNISQDISPATEIETISLRVHKDAASEIPGSTLSAEEPKTAPKEFSDFLGDDTSIDQKIKSIQQKEIRAKKMLLNIHLARKLAEAPKILPAKVLHFSDHSSNDTGVQGHTVTLRSKSGQSQSSEVGRATASDNREVPLKGFLKQQKKHALKLATTFMTRTPAQGARRVWDNQEKKRPFERLQLAVTIADERPKGEGDITPLLARKSSTSSKLQATEVHLIPDKNSEFKKGIVASEGVAHARLSSLLPGTKVYENDRTSSLQSGRDAVRRLANRGNYKHLIGEELMLKSNILKSPEYVASSFERRGSKQRLQELPDVEDASANDVVASDFDSGLLEERRHYAKHLNGLRDNQPSYKRYFNPRLPEEERKHYAKHLNDLRNKQPAYKRQFETKPKSSRSFAVKGVPLGTGKPQVRILKEIPDFDFERVSASLIPKLYHAEEAVERAVEKGPVSVTVHVSRNVPDKPEHHGGKRRKVSDLNPSPISPTADYDVTNVKSLDSIDPFGFARLETNEGADAKRSVVPVPKQERHENFEATRESFSDLGGEESRGFTEFGRTLIPNYSALGESENSATRRALDIAHFRDTDANDISE